MRLDLQAIADAPTTLDATADGEKVTARIPVARLGTFKDRRYGEFSITERDLKGWQENLAYLNGEAPIDYDHGPERGGSSEAAGWIKGLERDGDRVMASVEFTPQGAQAIRDGRWKFISPTFVSDLKDEQGRSRGPALKGAGLTNRPFLKTGMPAISLSEDLDGPDFAHQEASDTRRCMRLSTKTAHALGLSQDVEETVLLDALDDAVILSADAHQELVEKAAAGEKALEELADSKFDTAFTLAVDEGRAVPAQKDGMRELYDVAPERVLQMLAEAPKVLSTEPKGKGPGTDTTPEAPAGVDQDRFELDERAKAIALAENIDYLEALDRAEREFQAAGREV